MKVFLGLALSVVIFFVGSELGGKTTMKVIDLKPPRAKGNLTVEESIGKRRSVREFKSAPLTMDEIGQLLWAAQGVTESRTGLRASPSAGATYPLEVYVVTSDGLYHYRPDGHKLVLKHEGDLRKKLSEAALDQRWVAEAPAVFVIAADYKRTSRRYGTRATRYVDMEVGCASENIALEAVALNLGSGMVGAFDDAAVKKVLYLPDNEAPLMLIPVGHPRK